MKVESIDRLKGYGWVFLAKYAVPHPVRASQHQLVKLLAFGNAIGNSAHSSTKDAAFLLRRLAMALRTNLEKLPMTQEDF